MSKSGDADMNREKKSDILYVRTFGGFSIEWNGKRIDSDVRSGKSQFACLMQILLHNCGQGVSRDRLEEILFGGRDIADVHHTMQSVVYNAEKKLRQGGLPQEDYIILDKGVFFWTKKIPVEEDAARFEQLYREAVQEKDRERKLERYLQACDCYGGDFLPGQGSGSWAWEERERYRGIFRICVEEAADLLRKQADYSRLERLGRNAAKASASAEWDAMLMEALVAQGKYEEAGQTYDGTAERRFREPGYRTTAQFFREMDELGTRMEHRTEALHVIQERLEEEESGPGGYMCTYPVFRGIYSIMARMARESGEQIYLMSCTIVNGSGIPMREGQALEELSERLRDAVCSCVSRQDAITRYGRGQYLVLLSGRSRRDCQELQKQINEKFLVGRQRTGVRYYIRDVV